MAEKKISMKKMAMAAKSFAHEMAMASTEQKNEVLEAIRRDLKYNEEEILEANKVDVSTAKTAGLSESMIDRLSLQGRLEGVINELGQIINLPDPVGEQFEKQKIGQLEIVRQRTPIGVIGVIYESRPNVTLDVSALIIKSGNCAILRGGSETLKTNQVLVKVIQNALTSAKLPLQAIQLVQTPDRAQIKKLLRLQEYIDLIIPRGGASLHQFCRANSTIPVITGGVGVCHLFVDESADLERALPVIANAKIQRPTVCNALDTLLVHEKAADQFIALVIQRLGKQGVTFRLDPLAWQLVNGNKSTSCALAQKEDWDTEWLSLVLGIKIVKDLDEAMQHIIQHSTWHSDGILTENKDNARKFVKQIDSAAVYVNASTRFTDGNQLGLGAEVAISTQKIHARGPMALKELTSYKWIIQGDYTVRK